MVKNFLLCVAVSLFLVSCKTADSKIYLLPTLHSIHKINANYDYRHLKETVVEINPDIIAVEIRPEDISQDSLYLKKNYPYEMWMMKEWFPAKKILGFDWLGTDIENQLIPANYWKEISPIKKYEKALAEDSVYSAKKAKCEHFNTERLPILKTNSLAQLLKSKDAQLTSDFYQCFNESLQGSIHKRIPEFYAKRNQEILENIRKIILENKNKKILFLTGDDHYIFLKDKIKHQTIPEKTKTKN